MRVHVASGISALLVLQACGGGTDSQSASYMLQLDASSSTAGVEWVMTESLTPVERVHVEAISRLALGANAKLLTRPAPEANAATATAMAIYAREATGLTRLRLIERPADSASKLPGISAVLCADGRGNPVACTLDWVRQ